MHQRKRVLTLITVLTVFLLSAATPAAALFGRTEEVSAGDDGAPIAQNLEAETYRGIPYTGTLSAVDNEGDAFTFHIVEQPAKGTVALGEDGSFVYTPAAGKTGKDSFTYAATDTGGNESAPATVSINIRKQKTSVTYSDMEGHPSYNAAICLAEEGICVGRQVGGTYLFDPAESVSRSEFLAMAMDAAGLEVDPAVRLTGFADDDSIAVWAKSYASAAVREGLISGVSTGEGIVFQGGEAITLREAAAIMDRILNVTDVRLEETAAWSDQAVANMESVHVISAGSFGSEAASQTITRAQAAEILTAAIRLMEDQEDQGGGLFGWF